MNSYCVHVLQFRRCNFLSCQHVRLTDKSSFGATCDQGITHAGLSGSTDFFLEIKTGGEKKTSTVCELYICNIGSVSDPHIF